MMQPMPFTPEEVWAETRVIGIARTNRCGFYSLVMRRMRVAESPEDSLLTFWGLETWGGVAPWE